MTRNRRVRAAGVATAGVMAVLLATAAWAAACVVIPGVTLSPGSGPVGTVVTGKATGYTSDPTYSNVEVRWGGANGPIVAQGQPPLGKDVYEFSFKVPEAAGGSYAVYVTQRDESGAAAYGTPSRAVFTVPGATAQVPRDETPEQQVITIQQQHVIDPADPAPAQAAPGIAVPLEAQDSITTKVAPSDSRSATYELLANNRANKAPAQAGMALMAVGVMALLAAAAAVIVVRSASKEGTY